MSSDSEVDDLQRFEQARQRDLASKAGLRASTAIDEESSEEEVLGLDVDSSEDESKGQEGYYEQDDETIAERRGRTSRALDDNWGETRDNYFGGEDDIGAEEGASDEEEEEALRLQQRELEDMDPADFVDEDDLEGWKHTAEDIDDDPQVDTALIDPSAMTPDERRALLDEKFPAVALLSDELSKFASWREELSAEESQKPQEIVEAGRAALATYEGLIYSFFALFTDRLQSKGISGVLNLDEHPINEGLLMARQMWYNYRQWRPHGRKATQAHAQSSSLAPSAPSAGVFEDSEAESGSELEGSELGNEYGEDTDASSDAQSLTGLDEESEDEFSIARPEKSLPKATRPRVVGDFDETADTIEQQARAKNKQSLRFYTSQIGKGEIKRPDYSGDLDLPYRERDFERRQRLMAEAQKRGQQSKDVLGGDDVEDAREAPGSADANSAYARMKQHRAAQKEEKQKRHSEAINAARAGRISEYLAENPNVDKRAINYQIEKNKGLTRKRKKENRNARVKKRVRYDAAQKKLKGVRKVYQESQGPYQGELTGIRKNLTHSTRFKN